MGMCRLNPLENSGHWSIGMPRMDYDNPQEIGNRTPVHTNKPGLLNSAQMGDLTIKMMVKSPYKNQYQTNRKVSIHTYNGTQRNYLNADYL